MAKKKIGYEIKLLVSTQNGRDMHREIGDLLSASEPNFQAALNRAMVSCGKAIEEAATGYRTEKGESVIPTCIFINLEVCRKDS